MGHHFEWDEDLWEPPEPERERPRDPAIDRAKEAIRQLLAERDREVFHGRQVEIILERQFFHWITDFALGELVEEGEVGSETVELEKGSRVRVKFVFAPMHRYRKRQIKRAIEVIRDYSRPEVARACGVQAELLFKLALVKRGFALRAEDAREYAERVWTRTEHNIDFVVEKDGCVYGGEVKNRLDYIEREELELKLELCRHLGVTPLFIMRVSPKSYNYMIIQQGGFALIFETQIYPPGQEPLVERIRRVLRLPVVCSRAIPDGIIERFMKWHERRVKGV